MRRRLLESTTEQRHCRSRQPDVGDPPHAWVLLRGSTHGDMGLVGVRLCLRDHRGRCLPILQYCVQFCCVLLWLCVFFDGCAGDYTGGAEASRFGW
jgi:hypothetical protein